MHRFSNTYQVKNRIKKLTLIASTCGVIVHFAFIWLFYFLQVQEMVYYNILSTLFFVFTFYLVSKNHDPLRVFYCISVEVILHAYLATFFCGYEASFGYFILVLPPVFLLNFRWRIQQLFLYMFFVLIAFVILWVNFHNHSGYYLINETTVQYVSTSSIVCIIAIVFFILFYFSDLVIKNEEELMSTNTYLVQSNKEKTMMINETHHRVKNNLQMVITLLRLQASKIEDEAIAGMFKETQNRVLTIASLHERMYRLDNVETIDAQEYITNLVQGIIDNFAIEKKIRIELNIQPIGIFTGVMIPLSLIINELITNSLKYAFKHATEGIISLSLIEKENGYCDLYIGDNGIGFIEEEREEGLGTRLIKVFVRQINASIIKEDLPGTFYTLSFQNKVQ